MTNDLDKKKLKKAFDAIGERISLDQATQDFEDYLDANLARIVAEVDEKVFGPRMPAVASSLDRLNASLRTYVARFDAAFVALMGAVFPAVAAPALAGTRSGRGSPARTEEGTAARGEQEVAPLTPEQRKKELAALPDWVVVPHGASMFPGCEFAILWTRGTQAPALPALEIRLDGAPVADGVAWSYPVTDLEGLPGETTLVSFDGIKPAGCRMEPEKDGRLVLDFTTA